jgi:hypothetical protein
MKQVLRFFSVWMAIVLSFGNAVVGFTPVAVANVHISTSTPAGTIPLVSEWIQTNWPASNSFFSLYTSKDKVFARIWDSLNGGRMFLTTDDGTNWTQIGSADSNIDILSIVMLDSKILASTWNGFYLSTDDGKTWNAVTPMGIHADTPIWSIVMINSTLFAGITGGIYKSLDNGSTWTGVSSGIPVDVRITSIVASGNTIFAGSASNGVFKTTNGGTSWTAINSGLTDKHISQLAVLGTRMFAVTLTGVFISDNYGTNWAADNSGLENVNCFVVVNDQLFAGTDDNGVHRSTDGGVTWASFSSGIPANTRIWSLAVNSDGIFAGTSSGVWVTASPTEVKIERVISDPFSFSLKQNFPNPFNPSTTISFTLAKRSFVILKVYDILGREVETLINGEMQAGNHNQLWNAANLSSGIYFYRLQAGLFTETKKLVLLK